MAFVRLTLASIVACLGTDLVLIAQTSDHAPPDDSLRSVTQISRANDLSNSWLSTVDVYITGRIDRTEMEQTANDADQRYRNGKQLVNVLFRLPGMVDRWWATAVRESREDEWKITFTDGSAGENTENTKAKAAARTNVRKKEPSPSPRGRWSDDTGAYSVYATVVSVRSETIVLRKDDGSTVTVPKSRLSRADLNWLTSYSSVDSNKNNAATKELNRHEREAIQFVKQKLGRLLELKDSPAFIDGGFAVDGPHAEWMRQVREAHDTKRFGRGNAVAAVTDLLQLGFEYVSSKGRETKYSRIARNRLSRFIQSE